MRQLAWSAGGSEPWTQIRVPGRVNLIGDHTDYNGLPVMPLAIEREVRLAFRPRPGSIHLRNVNSAYEAREFRASAQINPYPDGDWGNYAKAAVQALVQWADMSGAPCEAGFEAVVDSTIPSGAGLSSSSALVVAFALAFAQANCLSIAPAELAELLARGERYVGTQGGGMDQAACLLSKAGHAMMIDFDPLLTTPIPIPESAAIIVANTLVRSEKSAAERQKYNLRPTEGCIASALLSARLGRKVKNLSDIVKANLDPEALVAANLPVGSLSGAEISGLLGISEDRFRDLFLTTREGNVTIEPQEGFKPAMRALHAIGEADRVRKAADALRAADLVRVGRLMNESHTSCRDLCEVSCDELEALTYAANRAGAYGARVTGAGFGGCVVALVDGDRAQEIIGRVIADYYRQWLPANRPDIAPADTDSLEQVIFSTTACAGADSSGRLT